MEVLGNRTSNQRIEIAETYKGTYGEASFVPFDLVQPTKLSERIFELLKNMGGEVNHCKMHQEE